MNFIHKIKIKSLYLLLFIDLMNKMELKLKEKTPQKPQKTQHFLYQNSQKMTNASVRLHTYECSSSCIMMAEGWGLIPLHKVVTPVRLQARVL